MMLSTTEKIYKLTDVDLAAKHWYVNRTPDDNLPKTLILALHGWLDNAGSFDFLAPELLINLNKYFPDSNIEICAPDLTGHGKSSHRPGTTPLNFIDYIVDIKQILNQIQAENNINKIILLGHSMGAGVSLLFNGCFPKSAYATICLDSSGPLTCETKDTPKILQFFLNNLSKFYNKKMPSYSSYEDARNARMKKTPMPPEILDALLKRSLIKINHNPDLYTWSNDPRLMFPPLYLFSEEQLCILLDQIKVPICLILAEEGFSIPQEIHQKRLDAIHNLSLYNVPGHHHIHMETPIPMVNAILDFIKKQNLNL